jgi:hypothetical protein
MFDLEDIRDALAIGGALIALFVFALLLSMCGGCGPSPRFLPIKLTASPTLSVLLDQAVAVINAEAETQGLPHVVELGLGVWVVEDKSPPGGSGTPFTCGYFDLANNEIGVRLGFGCGGQLQLAIVIHEIGHAAGLGHSTDPGSVMYPSVRQGWTPEQLARSLLAELDALTAERGP